jgi:hypothetical protein
VISRLAFPGLARDKFILTVTSDLLLCHMEFQFRRTNSGFTPDSDSVREILLPSCKRDFVTIMGLDSGSKFELPVPRDSVTSTVPLAALPVESGTVAPRLAGGLSPSRTRTPGPTRRPRGSDSESDSESESDRGGFRAAGPLPPAAAHVYGDVRVCRRPATVTDSEQTVTENPRGPGAVNLANLPRNVTDTDGHGASANADLIRGTIINLAVLSPPVAAATVTNRLCRGRNHDASSGESHLRWNSSLFFRLDLNWITLKKTELKKLARHPISAITGGGEVAPWQPTYVRTDKLERPSQARDS